MYQKAHYAAYKIFRTSEGMWRLRERNDAPNNAVEQSSATTTSSDLVLCITDDTSAGRWNCLYQLGMETVAENRKPG